MTAYDDLMAFQRDTEALGQVAGRLEWDQEVMMPRGAAEQRAEEVGAIQSVLHARRVDPRIGDWLAAIDDSTLDAVGQANLRHIRRSYARQTKIPADLAKRLAALASRAQGIWAEARQNEDVAGFLPVLSEIVALKREEAALLADGGDLYDALLDDYEPDTSAKEIEAVFAELRPRIVDLRAALLDKPSPAPLSGHFAESVQMQLTEEVARSFGYDFARGRVDKSVHPFSMGSGDDCRITTRTDERDPLGSLYSTIHEVGHACYEQNIAPEYRLTPLGCGVSMGVHESQSRIYENQLGRSEAFCSYLYGRMRTHFGDIGVESERDFYAAVNRLAKGYIRTEADEVQYNLHVMLRFDLERALIAGDLTVNDLELAWNERFAADFGYAPDKPSNGMLQDVHWSVGLFGYFPTYSLGNLYAGCLHEALRADLPDLDDQLARGDLAQATGWLKEKVQRHGGLMRPREVITQACGKAPEAEPLVRYLEAKFAALYGL